jgi:hypothetical protein
LNKINQNEKLKNEINNKKDGLKLNVSENMNEKNLVKNMSK